MRCPTLPLKPQRRCPKCWRGEDGKISYLIWHSFRRTNTINIVCYCKHTRQVTSLTPSDRALARYFLKCDKMVSWKVLSSENQGGSKVVSIQSKDIVLVLGCWIYFSLILRATILDFAKTVLPPLETKFLVMCERIGEALNAICSASQSVKIWYKLQ